MQWPKHLFSAVQFFQVLLLVFGGLFCLVLPFAPALRVTIAESFLFKDALFFCLGLILLSVGLILGAGFYFLQKHQTWQFSMNPPVTLDGPVVAAVVQTYLQDRFPGRAMKTEVLIDPTGTIELITDFPTPDVEKHLSEMEHEIGSLLQRTFNYNKKFIITFSA